jgi:hypothetical protein
MQIEVSVGEIVDKYTILLIKERRISEPTKLSNVTKERKYIESVLNEQGFYQKDFIDRLVSVNESLWDIEDRIRIKESLQQFDDEFISLARAVYHTNDDRAKIKRELNEKTSSNFVEEKQYAEYQ